MSQIINLEETHIPQIHQIYKPFAEDTSVSFEAESPSLEEFTTRVSGIAKKYPFLVLLENGIVKGYAYASTHRERAAYRWCAETSIYMADEAKGKGLGKTLYLALMNELISRNFTLAYGIITLPNDASVALHAACGFTDMAMHKNAGYKLGSWHTVKWMERELVPCAMNPKEPSFGG